MSNATSSGRTTWASWMDDRTTTAYSPNTHQLRPRVPPAPPPRRANAAPRRQTTQLRMAPQPPASARSDEAELMWLDDADLLSVSEPNLVAADGGGSVAAKCILPGFGLFAAVLLGHVILAASGMPAAAARPAVEESRSQPAAAVSGAPLQQPDTNE